ncbi:uncharacterized protein LOC116203549 [Punica granatum]|uniref:Uncharacterized protein n=2 Tax=Punica granatum TaxID=22663 RepID=A0A218XTY4_PUNGR|nr:uncharacterized protein LOC116203549 [Punica granatum]OWM87722.1 hypothetical protein CDL15_Pgr016418 [Punica granatum]PKI63382.1 hypothetical protein CRG98_016270 [Punica granatum]
MTSIKFLPIVFFLITLEPIAAIHYRVIDRTYTDHFSKFECLIRYHYSALRVFTEANEFVLTTFNLTPGAGKWYDEVRLIVESFKEYGLGRYPQSVASTVGNEIRINTDYLDNFQGDVYDEFVGILYHETTHLWQWDGKGKAPRGLIDGIADFVRLSAGWSSEAWTQQRGSGSRWDEGYAVTAYFLEYCNSLKHGFVSELNARMKHYYSDDFFKRLLGKDVRKLWEDYKAAYEEENQVLASNKNQTYAQLEELVPEDNVPKGSDSSEGYLQIDVKGVFSPKIQISAPTEDNLENKLPMNNDATEEKVKLLGRSDESSKSPELVSTAEEDQGTLSFPMAHFSHVCTDFKDCLAAELKKMARRRWQRRSVSLSQLQVTD